MIIEGGKIKDKIKIDAVILNITMTDKAKMDLMIDQSIETTIMIGLQGKKFERNSNIDQIS